MSSGKPDEFLELLRLLHGDVKLLFDLTFKHNAPVPEANIRAASTILRRWLVDGDLERISRELIEPIKFPVSDTAPIVERVANTGTIDFFVTAGVMMNGFPIEGIHHSPLAPEENDIFPLLPMRLVHLDGRSFIRQKRLLYKSRWFTTEEILRYVANKLGGNHFDLRRPKFYGDLDGASQFMRYGGPEDGRGNSELYLILEPKSSEVIDGVHLEVIAIAASFIQASVGNTQLGTITVDKPGFLNPRRWMRRKPTFRFFDNADGGGEE